MALRFKSFGRLFCIRALCAILIVSSFGFAEDKAKTKTYTGTVGDALCGIEHSMPVSAVECIRKCIGKGSNYSLIVGDKVYALETSDQAVLDILEKQAGEKVRVSGIEKGNSIEVSSVKGEK
ncbi:MAG TPA: hypothetical protein VI386_07820 [Candidatus Sulfotelmatobacter sp.]